MESRSFAALVEHGSIIPEPVVLELFCTDLCPMNKINS
jgi:hypothetical protein